MGTMDTFREDVDDEISTILASDFDIEITKTNSVPHSDDPAITFPNLDEKTQGTKLIATTVLYVDMRRSTALSMKHRAHTVARLYSAFVRAIARCADYFGGEVRGIIGDRVMVIFNSENCFTNAVDTAELINSVCIYVINKHFTQNEVTFGIGIDYGNMLATKTGIRRHGSAQQSYRSLVWLARPANIASKLTDHANKPAETSESTRVHIAFSNGAGGLTFAEEYPFEFVQKFQFNSLTGRMEHSDPRVFYFSTYNKTVELKPETPSILMTRAVYDGFKAARPNAVELENGWFTKIAITIPDYNGDVYGGGVIYTVFRG
jgi:adenylate cyclase